MDLQRQEADSIHKKDFVRNPFVKQQSFDRDSFQLNRLQNL